MKKVLFVLLSSVLLVTVAKAQVIGMDNFTYPDGVIDGQTGGVGWAWFNNSQTQTNSGGVSAWLKQWAGSPYNPYVSDHAFFTIAETGECGALRDYGTNREEAAFAGGEGLLYYSIFVVPLENVEWFGVSSYDQGTERFLFGQIYNQKDPKKLGIMIGSSQAFSDIEVLPNQTYWLVAGIDLSGDQLRLWINPDTADYDNGAADNSADVVAPYEGSNWSSGIRVASKGPCMWDNLLVTTTFDELFGLNPTPVPANGAVFVSPENVTLSWNPVPDPNDLAAPDMSVTAYRLYGNFGNPNDPNLYFVDEISNTGQRLEYTPLTLANDAMYSWRVDAVIPDANDNEVYDAGMPWNFQTEQSIPLIVQNPIDQLVGAGETATFSIEVVSVTAPTYQWYRFVDGTNDTPLFDGSEISGAKSDVLFISGVDVSDEGEYYCVVSNSSEIPVTSARARLWNKRRIAYWDFEMGNVDSTVVGSPVSVLEGTPEIVAGASFDGSDAMVFEDGELLYTNPNEAAYFDVCNSKMTVACWVKTSDNQSWVPFVARDGESGKGWQLRHRDNTRRPCLTTRGMGNEDGTAGNRQVIDNTWHYIVGTFDGTVKKLYIDGMISLVYSQDNGSIIKEGDAVSGRINATSAPLAIAGRVRGEPGNLDIQVGNVCAGVYDGVAIYNYALDARAVAQVYADATGKTLCPTPQPYDLNGDCVVDLSDMGRLASEWLSDVSVSPNL